MQPIWLSAVAGIIRRLPRGRYRALHALARSVRIPPFTARFPRGDDGLTFECDIRNSLAREVYFTGQYEPQETALIEELLKPGQTFVDVGAHWGYFTLIAAQRVSKTGRVISIEADPRIFETLERNINENNLTNVTPVQVAAAAGTGVLQMQGYNACEDNWGVSRLLGSMSPLASVPFDVPTMSIDSLLDQHGIGAVDLLKMDIEGAEALALRGMEAGLRAGRYRAMVVELHPHALPDFGSNVEALAASMTALGYRAWRIDNSAAAIRRSAYNAVSPRELIEPWAPGATIDEWPHVLWSLSEPKI